jgi:1,4-dihydroxy-2-naphthoate polyprenyltransferase
MPQQPAPSFTPSNNSMKAWLSAARPRTLPLALSSILMGSFLAAATNSYNPIVFVLAVLTTTCLQILSNLANDYGDSVHGADSADREGPPRAVQAGLITAAAMKRAMIIFGFLSLASGIALLWIGLAGASWVALVTLFGMGIAAIVAAITYTSGSRPYGYAGLGDISVLLFFGLLGVMGTFYLHTQILYWELILPALSCGLFATAVLNVNNIRDIESDRKAGKKSIPVRLGRERARIYHLVLIVLGMMFASTYVVLDYMHPVQWLFLLVIPVMVKNITAVFTKSKAHELDPFLKQMALSTLLFVILFGIGQLISAWISG